MSEFKEQLQVSGREEEEEPAGLLHHATVTNAAAGRHAAASDAPRISRHCEVPAKQRNLHHPHRLHPLLSSSNTRGEHENAHHHRWSHWRSTRKSKKTRHAKMHSSSTNLNIRTSCHPLRPDFVPASRSRLDHRSRSGMKSYADFDHATVTDGHRRASEAQGARRAGRAQGDRAHHHQSSGRTPARIVRERPVRYSSRRRSCCSTQAT